MYKSLSLCNGYLHMPRLKRQLSAVVQIPRHPRPLEICCSNLKLCPIAVTLIILQICALAFKEPCNRCTHARKNFLHWLRRSARHHQSGFCSCNNFWSASLTPVSCPGHLLSPKNVPNKGQRSPWPTRLLHLHFSLDFCTNDRRCFSLIKLRFAQSVHTNVFLFSSYWFHCFLSIFSMPFNSLQDEHGFRRVVRLVHPLATQFGHMSFRPSVR